MMEKLLLILLLGLGYAWCEPEELSVDKEEKPGQKTGSKTGSMTGPQATTASPSARKPGGQAVDCKRLCRRTFDQCIVEVMTISGKLGAKQLRTLKRAGRLGLIKKKGYQACLRDCNKKGGKGSDVVKIKRCMRIKSCTAYAKCIKKVM